MADDTISTTTQVRKSYYESILKGLTPAKLSKILTETIIEGSLEFFTLAEEMEERDAHYRSVLTTRKSSIIGLSTNVADNGDQSQVEFIKNIVHSASFKHMMFDLLDGLGKGFSVIEINYGEYNNKLIPISFTRKLQEWFIYKDNEIQLRTCKDKSKHLPPFKTITHIPQLKSGSLIRGGLARAVATPFILKNYAMKDWGSFLEVFGMPLRLGRYPSGASKEDREILKKAIMSLGSDAGAIIPETMAIEFINAGGSSNSDTFEKYIRLMDEQISKAVLGQTMTTENGSSQSQAEVYNDVRFDILKADSVSLADTINQYLIIPLIVLNFGEQHASVGDAYPVISFIHKELSEKQEFRNTIKDIAPPWCTFFN